MLIVRQMSLEETELIIRYFYDSPAEHLELLGVDPTRLPRPESWREHHRREYELPVDQRATMPIIWLFDDEPIGFSTADKIAYGEQANMHLHVIDAHRRGKGFGTECVRETAKVYFDQLAIQRLLCEPNAFNVAPNRTLQKAGFKYLKTHRTVPGPLNYHQPVTRWILERPVSSSAKMAEIGRAHV